MAIANHTVQEELCKGCTHFKLINDSKAYCPFGRCLWNESGSEINGKIKTITFKNRLNGEVKAIDVYLPREKQVNI